MALPCGTTGSLYPTFVPARLVSLTVKHPYAIALYARLPSVLRVPLKASDTLLEATTPVKLPTKQCPPQNGVRLQINKGWYFKVDSMEPSDPTSLPPTYPTHHLSKVNVKL
jgi:hypothetical protein